MRQNSEANIRVSKAIARQKYKERQIDKYTNWAMESRGYLKWHELVAIQDKHEVKIYG
jgi:hypothetical protein